MARSANCYVVIPQGCMTPCASFTVKHELHSWIETQAVRHRVYRVRDGARDMKVTDITEKVYE